MSPYLLLVAFVVYGLPTTANAQGVCYNTDQDVTQREQFSHITAYDAVYEPFFNRTPHVPGCTIAKVWMICRHGARLPQLNHVQQISNELPKLRDTIRENYANGYAANDKLCPEDLSGLDAWQWEDPTGKNFQEELLLVPQGTTDLTTFGARFRQRFDYFFSKSNDENFTFRYTKTQRTEASFRAFVEGFFNDPNYNPPTQPVQDLDVTLFPHVTCQLFIDLYSAIKKPDTEFSKFLISDTFLSTISDISRRLGFQTDLNESQVNAMWDACRYEQAWYPDRRSPWCGVFSRENINVLEYKEDIFFYYLSGYGYANNADVACFAIQDFIRHIESDDNEHLVGYFAHDLTIEMILNVLQYHKDDPPLRADNYESLRRRQYRTSRTPFGANLVVVKHHCEYTTDEIKVEFYLNETPLHPDWCGEPACRWYEIRDRLNQYADADCKSIYCTK